MKTFLALLSAASLLAATPVFAGPRKCAPRLVGTSLNPALRLDNVRWDSQDGKVRGSASVNPGYSVPDRSHVHIYALNASGKILYAGCDTLSSNSLATRPEFPRGSDAFSAKIPASLKGLATIEVVAASGHSDCQPDDNRILKLFR